MNTISKVNPRLRAAIKLRHLLDATAENWNQLSQVEERVKTIIENANAFMASYGTSQAKETYASEMPELMKNIDGLGGMLKTISEAIKKNEVVSLEVNKKDFQNYFSAVEKGFLKFENYSEMSFNKCNFQDWKNSWKIAKSNLLAVKGISEAAYLKLQMMADFNKEELDTLTQAIVKNIPQSYSIAEADKYEKEYLEAMKQIETESNQKDNLWDRFLNLLAGGMPFKQSPEERVMMQRWINGEKGELN